MTTNPLIGIQFRIPFDKIQADQVSPAVKLLLAEARDRLKLFSATETRTFANTMMALDSLTERLDYAMGIVRHLEAVATYPELRAAYNEVQPEVSAFYSSIPLDAGLWKAIKDFAASREANELTGVRRRFLTKALADFRRHGADLDASGKAKLEEMDIELLSSQLTLPKTPWMQPTVLS